MNLLLDQYTVVQVGLDVEVEFLIRLQSQFTGAQLKL